MKVVVICVVFCTCVIKSVLSGPFGALLYSDWITCDHNKSLSLDVSQIQVYFYDFQNNFNATYEVDDFVPGITSKYNLDVTRKLLLFVPGYKSNISKKPEELMRQTFRDVPNVYLLIIDHSTYTSAQGGKIKSYERSVFYASYIGKALGKLLSDLHTKGYPSNNIHCIGHSLGAQMLASTGIEYFNKTGEKLWRITGLDPAGPCFSNSFIDDQIRSGVAQYVEVYHCNAGGLGTTSVLGDADFFINRGKHQPKCSGSFLGIGESDDAKCSHKKCVSYWAETVHKPGWYLAWACNSYESFSKGICAANEVTIAGYSNPGNATGVFYVSTETFGIK